MQSLGAVYAVRTSLQKVQRIRTLHCVLPPYRLSRPARSQHRLVTGVPLVTRCMLSLETVDTVRTAFETFEARKNAAQAEIERLQLVPVFHLRICRSVSTIMMYMS